MSESVSFSLSVVVCLTVREVKVRQMPPKPFRERARKMSADSTAEKRRNTKNRSINSLSPNKVGGHVVHHVQQKAKLQKLDSNQLDEATSWLS